MKIHVTELKQRLVKAAQKQSRADHYQLKALRAERHRATSSGLPYVEYPSCNIVGWYEKKQCVRVLGWTKAEIARSEKTGIPLAALPPVRAMRLELILQYEGMEVVW